MHPPNANKAVQARLANLLKHFTNTLSSSLNLNSLSTLAAQLVISRMGPSEATAHAVAHIITHPPGPQLAANLAAIQLTLTIATAAGTQLISQAAFAHKIFTSPLPQPSTAPADAMIAF